jgi:hypothetical protein
MNVNNKDNELIWESYSEKSEMVFDPQSIKNNLYRQYQQKCRDVIEGYILGKTIKGYLGWFENGRHEQGEKEVMVKKVTNDDGEVGFVGSDGKLYHFYDGDVKILD